MLQALKFLMKTHYKATELKQFGISIKVKKQTNKIECSTNISVHIHGHIRSHFHTHNYCSIVTASQQVKAMQISFTKSFSRHNQKYKDSEILLSLQKAGNIVPSVKINVDGIMQNEMSQPQKDRLYKIHERVTLLETKNRVVFTNCHKTEKIGARRVGSHL